MAMARLPGFLRIPLAAATLVVTAAVLAGCGGGGVPAGTGSGSSTRTLFIEYCGGCHTLAAAGTKGTAGPNLDQARSGYDDVVELVTNGRGAMPAFGQSLTRARIQAIARYVSTAAR